MSTPLDNNDMVVYMEHEVNVFKVNNLLTECALLVLDHKPHYAKLAATAVLTRKLTTHHVFGCEDLVHSEPFINLVDLVEFLPAADRYEIYRYLRYAFAHSKTPYGGDFHKRRVLFRLLNAVQFNCDTNALSSIDCCFYLAIQPSLFANYEIRELHRSNPRFMSRFLAYIIHYADVKNHPVFGLLDAQVLGFFSLCFREVAFELSTAARLVCEVVCLRYFREFIVAEKSNKQGGMTSSLVMDFYTHLTTISTPTPASISSSVIDKIFLFTNIECRVIDAVSAYTLLKALITTNETSARAICALFPEIIRRGICSINPELILITIQLLIAISKHKYYDQQLLEDIEVNFIGVLCAIVREYEFNAEILDAAMEWFQILSFSQVVQEGVQFRTHLFSECLLHVSTIYPKRCRTLLTNFKLDYIDLCL